MGFNITGNFIANVDKGAGGPMPSMRGTSTISRSQETNGTTTVTALRRAAEGNNVGIAGNTSGNVTVSASAMT